MAYKTGLRISLAELAFSKQAHELKVRQRRLPPGEIVADVERKHKERLSAGSVPASDFFGISGVYYLFRGLDCIYIGESVCVYSRIAEHIRSGKEFDAFKYERIQGVDARKKREASLIRQHRPLHNFQHNPNLLGIKMPRG